jgi:D12 class N6 adenine-specific DNA methyltransferase
MWSRSRSPLRYPGSKARFARFIAQALRLNGLRNQVLVEPFCGGASMSIALLEAGVVSEIALNDADPAIAAFWGNIRRTSGIVQFWTVLLNPLRDHAATGFVRSLVVLFSHETYPSALGRRRGVVCTLRRFRGQRADFQYTCRKGIEPLNRR